MFSARNHILIRIKYIFYSHIKKFKMHSYKIFNKFFVLVILKYIILLTQSKVQIFKPTCMTFLYWLCITNLNFTLIVCIIDIKNIIFTSTICIINTKNHYCRFKIFTYPDKKIMFQFCENKKYTKNFVEINYKYWYL